jgi:hypothetical protein
MEAIKESGDAVSQFMTDFTQTYMSEMVNAKIEGAIEDAVDSMKDAAGAAEEEDDGTEEKALEDKEEGVPPLASGVVLCGYKHGWGPDRAYHRYYDLAVFAIKAQDSVVDKVTYRHRQLQTFAARLRKKLGEAMPACAFPGKKITKKDVKFYKARFDQMLIWFNMMSDTEAVRMDEDWLKFFQLEFDAARAERRELFFTALEAQCEKDGINWESALKTAQRLGCDLQEVEMLKVVAIEKVGRDARAKIHTDVYSGSKTGFLPVSVKSKMVSKMDGKLAAMIGTAVETGWTAAEPAFAKAADALSAAMDEAMAPLQALFEKILEPVKELIASKMSKKDDDEEEEEASMDDRIKAIGAARFPPIASALEQMRAGTKGGAAANSEVRTALYDLNCTWKYTPYVQYNCGDPEIVEWFPPIERLTEKHQRLTVALIDTVWVLSRGLCRALHPLMAYADEAAKDFNSVTHEDKVKEALQAGGKKLAMDYFYLPSTLWRATWWCGSSTTKEVVKYARISVNEAADLMGSVAAAWKPSSSSDAMQSLADALEAALNEYIGNRALALVTLVRTTAIDMIAEIFEEVAGDSIDSIASTLDELVSKLPPPLSDLQPGEIVKTMLGNMLQALSEKTVMRWAQKCELALIGDGDEPTPWDEALATRFRCAPRIINSDDDLSKPQSSSSSSDDDKASAAAE